MVSAESCTKFSGPELSTGGSPQDRQTEAGWKLIVEPESPTRSGLASIKDLDAVILAGGLGTRLRPALPDRPKALARKIHERCHKWSPSGPNLRYDSIG